IARVTQAYLQIHSSGANEFFELAIEVLHAFLGAIVHSVDQALALTLALFDIFASTHGGFQDFENGHASFALAARQQALRDDKTKSFRKAVANRLLIGKREDAYDALDGFRGIDGVQRGKDQVACFRRFQRDFDRFAVAHFADQNDLGRLPQGGAQSQGECRSIAVEFALMYGGLFVVMAKLNRIFDAQDVNSTFGVGAIDDSRQSR